MHDGVTGTGKRHIIFIFFLTLFFVRVVDRSVPFVCCFLFATGRITGKGLAQAVRPGRPGDRYMYIL